MPMMAAIDYENSLRLSRSYKFATMDRTLCGYDCVSCAPSAKSMASASSRKIQRRFDKSWNNRAGTATTKDNALRAGANVGQSGSVT